MFTIEATSLQFASKLLVEQSYMMEVKPRSIALWILAGVRP